MVPLERFEQRGGRWCDRHALDSPGAQKNPMAFGS